MRRAQGIRRCSVRSDPRVCGSRARFEVQGAREASARKVLRTGLEWGRFASDSAVVFDDREDGPTEVLSLREERDVVLNRGWTLKRAVILRRA